MSSERETSEGLKTRLRRILVLANVKLDEGSADDDPLPAFERWIDFGDSSAGASHATATATATATADGTDDGTTAKTLEDSGTPSLDVFRGLSDVLCCAWKVPWSPLVDVNSSLDQIEAVRGTQWVQHLMELHVSEDDRSFSSILLGSVPFQDLVDSLFHHINLIPQLQQTINSHTESLMKFPPGGVKDPDSDSLASTSALTRLERFERAQRRGQILQEEMDRHLSRLEFVVGEWYSIGTADARRLFRHQFGTVWYHFVRTTAHRTAAFKENTSASALSFTLRIVHRILQGAEPPLHASYRHLLLYQLLPLHQPSAMVLWRDQTALLELYHEPLVQCVARLIRCHPEWKSTAISGLLSADIWPQSKGGKNGGNTPKIVLLLHEIDILIKLPGSLSPTVWTTFVARLAACVSSENSRLAECALQFFRNQSFSRLLHDEFSSSSSIPIFLRAMVKSDLPWNPTVRKMTYHVLMDLRKHHRMGFDKACEEAFGGSTGVSSPQRKNAETEERASSRAGGSALPPVATATSSSADFSLKAGMGNWRPPPPPSSAQAPGCQGVPPQSTSMPPPMARRPASGSRGKQATAPPPLTITGVAPWAVQGNSNSNGSRQKDPPLTVTGVAPWASSASRTPPPPSSSSSLSSSKRQSHNGTPSSLVAESKEGDGADNHPANSKAVDRVLDYMAQLKPPDDGGGGASSWSKTQMAETPTLLPTLKFHNLVFGHDLGSGAFGTVKYSRLIDRTVTRSKWTEYAVKIISTTKIQEQGYEHSVRREIAILRVLAHPGIARLISTFRFKDGAYLVLEYASRGDLHSLLKKSGSLDDKSTQFVMGEVVAALHSIHDAGFVYGDLKPENILITETGHIKLTDFGGSRPYTDAAKELVKQNKNILRDLRDGDWKEQTKEEEDEHAVSGWSGNDDREKIEEKEDGGSEDEDDLRIEGTTAYLPPEVVMGAIPTISADAWALGCVIYQCLSGRPPLLEDDDEMTRQKIVSFDGAHDERSGDALFGESHGKDIRQEARMLIRHLLSRNPLERPNLITVAEHDFFAGSNVFELYKQEAHPLDTGTVAPSSSDAKWTRRQLSSIWAPQPKPYDISMPSEVDQSLQTPGKPRIGPIREGEERNAFFSLPTTSPGLLTSVAGVRS